MHDYNTILGVIGLRLSKVSYDSVQKRYRIGRSGIALIMNRYKDSGLSLMQSGRRGQRNVLIV